jgi:hypothetical protein
LHLLTGANPPGPLLWKGEKKAFFVEFYAKSERKTPLAVKTNRQVTCGRKHLNRTGGRIIDFGYIGYLFGAIHTDL